MAEPDPSMQPPGRRRRRQQRLLIAAGLVAAGLAALGLGVDGAALRAELSAGATAVTAWAEAHPLAAVAAFVGFAALGKISPLPGGMVVMLTGGFLFGALAGGALAAAGSALAAGGIAGLGRLVLGPPGRRPPTAPDAPAWRRRLDALAAVVERNGFVSILTLRLLPMTPAWLANLVPLVVAIPTLHVMLATFLGVLPLSVVAAALGSRLADLSQAATLDWRALTAPATLWPLAALTALALLPPVLARFRRPR
jgi:uncharacterized membrane protein YdjX (TVP38/TMEM64 family)